MMRLLSCWCIGFVGLFSVHVFAASSDEIIDGFADFLISRGEANTLAIFERKLKSNEDFKCYFPNTYSNVKNVSLKNLFDNKAYWEGGIERDLEALAIRLMLKDLERESSISKASITLISEYIELMQFFEYRDNGGSYSLTQLPLDPSKKQKDIVNGFYLPFLSIADALKKLEIYKNPCSAPAIDFPEFKKEFSSLYTIDDDFRKLKDHTQKNKSNLWLTKAGEDRVCAKLSASDMSCSDLKKNSSIWIKNQLAKIQELVFPESINKFIDGVEKIEAGFLVLPPDLIEKINTMKKQTPLLASQNFTPVKKQKLENLLTNIAESKGDIKDNAVKALTVVKSSSDMNDSDVKEFYGELKEVFSYKQSKTLQANFVLKQIKEKGFLSGSQLDTLVDCILFFTKIADAEDKDMVVSILKSSTLPDVSFAEKRKAGFRVFVSSYFGVGVSVVDDHSSSEKVTDGGSLFVPVGLEFNYGFNNSGSISAMLAPIDMAYPISLKLDGANSSAKFDEIFTPSIAVSYGFKDYPVVLGLGYQKGQVLEDVNKSENRYLLFIGFDLPLFRMF